MSVHIEFRSIDVVELHEVLAAHRRVVEGSVGPNSITRTDSEGAAFVRNDGPSHFNVRTVGLSLLEAEQLLARHRHRLVKDSDPELERLLDEEEAIEQEIRRHG